MVIHASVNKAVSGLHAYLAELPVVVAVEASADPECVLDGFDNVVMAVPLSIRGQNVCTAQSCLYTARL